MCRTDNIWTKKVKEWQLRNSKRSQGRPKIWWKDEIMAFTGVGWSTLTSDRERWKGLGKAFVLQLTQLVMADDDDALRISNMSVIVIHQGMITSGPTTTSGYPHSVSSELIITNHWVRL